MNVTKVLLVGNIKNVLPWRESSIPTVKRSLLEKHTYSDRVVILQEDITVMFWIRSQRAPFLCVAKAGYPFDYASIPRGLSCIFKHNDRRLMIGALVHDIGFNHKYGGLEMQAGFLRELSKYYKYPKFKRRIVELAVRGNIARHLFATKTKFDFECQRFSNIGKHYD